MTMSPAGVRRVVVLLMMTLLFGLQSVAISAAISNDINHAFSAVEHQDTQTGISTYHDGCSAKNSLGPLDLLESIPLAGTSSTLTDVPAYHWVATLSIEFAVADQPTVSLFFPPSPPNAAYTTPILLKDILLI